MTSITKAATIVGAAVDIKQPVMLLGSPGIGKSALVQTIADSRGLRLVDLRLSQLDSVDLRGVPSVVGGVTRWNTPSFFADHVDTPVLLLLDEITQADLSVERAAFQLVHDRRLGDFVLPDHWAVVAAGNRSKDLAGANTLSTAMKNRFLIVECSSSATDWLTWATAANIHPSITGIISYRPELLDAFASSGTSNEKRIDQKAINYATPRSWHKLSHFLNSDLNLEDDHVLSALCVGTLGAEAGAEMASFYRRTASLPTIEEILADPKHVRIPKEIAESYAFSALIIYHITNKNLSALYPAIERLPSELQVIVMRGATEKDIGVSVNPDFARWTAKNSAFI